MTSIRKRSAFSQFLSERFPRKQNLLALAFLTRLMTCLVFGMMCVVLCIPYIGNFLIAIIPSQLEWLGIALLCLSLLVLLAAGFLVGVGFCWLIKHSFEEEI